MSSAFTGRASKEHLIRGGGLAHEISKLRQDTSEAFNAAEQLSVRVARIERPTTGLVLANGIMASFKSADDATPVTLTVVEFTGALSLPDLDLLINSPKKITFTVAGTGTPANWKACDVTFTGTDSDDQPLVEVLALDGGANTKTTVGYFKTLSQIEWTNGATGSTNADLTIGVAADLSPICDIASSTTDQIIDGTVALSWNRARLGNRTLAHPRRLSFVFSNHTQWGGQTVSVRGRDALGVQITSTFAATATATRTTDKFFSSIERITVPGHAGTAGTCTVGLVESEVGLSLDPLDADESATVIREVSRVDSTVAWVAPTAGAVNDAVVANAGPYGSYVPHGSVPFNGVRDFIVAYIPK